MSDPYYTPLALSELTDRVRTLESKNKNLLAHEDDFRKRIERLEAQFDIQGARVMQPKLYDSAKKAPDVMPHVVDLNDFENKFNEFMWKMVEVIGMTGTAKYPHIDQIVKKEMLYFSENQLRKAATKLTGMNVLKHTELNLPLTPRITLYSLTPIGDRLFRKKFKVAPVPSEMVKVIKEHDNLQHGYGILDLAQLLADSDKYKKVYTFNRAQPLRFDNGTQYIPDIMCRNLDGKTKTYFEYERGNHTQKDFNAKCDKMCIVTEVLNFVAPNQKDLAKKLYPLIKEWIKKKGSSEYSNTIIRLTTPRDLKACRLNEHAWKIVFDLSQGIEPVICNVQVD